MVEIFLQLCLGRYLSVPLRALVPLYEVGVGWYATCGRVPDIHVDDLACVQSILRIGWILVRFHVQPVDLWSSQGRLEDLHDRRRLWYWRLSEGMRKYK